MHPFSINRRLKAVQATASRRVKVAIRRLGKQQLTEGEVLDKVRVLRRDIRQKN